MTTLRISVLVLAVLTLGAIATASESVPAGQIFSGTYDWKDGGSEKLVAEFVPSGENTWDVTFRFRWNGDDNKWTGTAEGILSDGEIVSGTATTGRRNWVFEATIGDGVMRGQHTEKRKDGSSYETGTFEIRR